MFTETLETIVNNTDGAIAGLLMGFDGIAVDKFVAPTSELNVEIVGMEYSVLLKGVQNAAKMLEAGDAKEVSIQAEGLTAVMRFITDEYFLAMALKPGGNIGKARYLMRINGPKLAENLV